MPKKAPAKGAAPAAAQAAPAPQATKAPAKAAAKSSGKAVAKAAPKAATFEITLYDETAIKPEGDARNGINIGVTTGLRFTHFVNQLLFNNYDAQLNDEELQDVIMKEFPNRESIQDMARYRACFNAGSAGFGVPDETGTLQKLAKENRLPKYGAEPVAAAE